MSLSAHLARGVAAVSGARRARGLLASGVRAHAAAAHLHQRGGALLGMAPRYLSSSAAAQVRACVRRVLRMGFHV